MAEEGETSSSLIVHRKVDVQTDYNEYKYDLRYDFWYSCAYCTLTEIEGAGVRFTIDHWIPQTADETLACVYTNLMWACDPFNVRKGDRYPSASARANGVRFFNPTMDTFLDHFEITGVLLKPKTAIARFTHAALDLDKLHLRRIRELRRRLFDTDQYIRDGIRGLREFPIDSLKPLARASALISLNKAEDTARLLSESIENFLMDCARSPMLEPDPEQKTRAAKRAAELKALAGIYPGVWRGRDRPAIADKTAQGGNGTALTQSNSASEEPGGA